MGDYVLDDGTVIPCTCLPDCPGDCKGECGCEACREAYADWLAGGGGDW